MMILFDSACSLGLVTVTLLIVSYTGNSLGAHDYKKELDSETTDNAALLQVALHFASNPASSERAQDGTGDHNGFVSGTSLESQHGASFGLASNKGRDTSKKILKEYVAMAPNAGKSYHLGFPITAPLEWVELEYPEGVSSANDVNMNYVSQSIPALGSWYGLSIHGGVALTGRVYGDNLYILMPSLPIGPTGCCSDRLRIYPRGGGGGNFTELPLDKVVQSAMGTTSAQVSHTFDLTTLADGTFAALLLVRYIESALGNAQCTSIVGINLADGSLIQTATGKKSFNVFKEAGTTSSEGEHRFKIMFNSTSKGREEFHGNGVQRFTSSSGVTLLAFSHRYAKEVVVFKDPFTHADGGIILQRFGTPFGHHFGVSSSASDFPHGLHSVWYTPKSLALGGVESITTFVNSQDGKSQAYEFALALKEEGGAGDPGDLTVFSTKYVHATCPFEAEDQGGARSIGNGVFLIASGADPTGVAVVDVSGNTKSIAYPATFGPFLFDPFIRILA